MERDGKNVLARRVVQTRDLAVEVNPHFHKDGSKRRIRNRVGQFFMHLKTEHESQSPRNTAQRLIDANRSFAAYGTHVHRGKIIPFIVFDDLQEIEEASGFVCIPGWRPKETGHPTNLLPKAKYLSNISGINDAEAGDPMPEVYVPEQYSLLREIKPGTRDFVETQLQHTAHARSTER